MKTLDLKKIIKYLIIFAILCIILFYANSLNVKAASLPSSCQFYDNRGSSAIQQLTIAGDGYWTTENSFTLTANGYGGIAVCSLDTPIVNNNVYSLTSHFDLVNATSRTSSKPNLGLGNSISEALTSYFNNTNLTENSINYSSSVLSYVFTANSNGSFIAIPFGSTSTISITPYLRNFTITYQGNSNQLTQNDIQNIISNSNEELKNSIKNSNEELKDTIDSGLNNCRDSYNLFNPSGGSLINGKGIGSDGSIIDDSTGSYYDYYISVKPSTTYNLSNKDNVQFAGSWFFAFYDNNKNFISLNRLGESSTNFTFTTSSNTSYIRLYSYLNLANVNSLNNIMLSEGSSKKNFENYGKLCTSKLDDTNDKLDDLNSNLTDSSDPNLAIGDVAGWLPPGPVDSVLNLPLTILNSLITNLSNRTCTSVNLPLPYVDQTIQLPCLSTIFNQTGFTDVLNTISVPFAIFIYINTLIKLYGWVDTTLQFREEHWNDVDQWGGI